MTAADLVWLIAFLERVQASDMVTSDEAHGRIGELIKRLKQNLGEIAMARLSQTEEHCR